MFSQLPINLMLKLDISPTIRTDARISMVFLTKRTELWPEHSNHMLLYNSNVIRSG